jgi:hypothetical protein
MLMMKVFDVIVVRVDKHRLWQQTAIAVGGNPKRGSKTNERVHSSAEAFDAT